MITDYTDTVFHKTITADNSAETATFTDLPTNGDSYTLRIAIGNHEPVAYTGYLADTTIEPYVEENVTVTGSTYTLALPTLKDWHRLYVYENDVPKQFGVTYVSKKFPYIVRGRTKLSELTFTPTSRTSSLKIVLEDYAGNQATTYVR